MGLSSNVIWHQTSFEGLKGILMSGHFKCSYSLENINWKKSHLEIAFPMLSFCDLPLSDIDDYLGKYGKYTLGLKKSWGQKSGFTPVWYQNPQSTSLCAFTKLHKTLLNTPYKEDTKLVWHVLSCLKNYEGSLKKYGFTRYRFYDEREIRFVPSLECIDAARVQPILSAKGYEDYKEVHAGLSLIDAIQIPFDMSDIAYILVSSSSQIHRVKKILGDDANNILLLSYQQVKEDIIGLCHNRE